MGKEALNLERATESCGYSADPALMPEGTCQRGIQASVEHKRSWFSLRRLKAATEAGFNPRLNLSQTILSAGLAIASSDNVLGGCFLSRSFGGSIKVVAYRADKELVSAMFLNAAGDQEEKWC